MPPSPWTPAPKQSLLRGVGSSGRCTSISSDGPWPLPLLCWFFMRVVQSSHHSMVLLSPMSFTAGVGSRSVMADIFGLRRFMSAGLWPLKSRARGVGSRFTGPAPLRAASGPPMSRAGSGRPSCRPSHEESEAGLRPVCGCCCRVRRPRRNSSPSLIHLSCCAASAAKMNTRSRWWGALTSEARRHTHCVSYPSAARSPTVRANSPRTKIPGTFSSTAHRGRSRRTARVMAGQMARWSAAPLR